MKDRSRIIASSFNMAMPLLFILGLAVGSFVNVAALRYDPDRGLFGQRSLKGRSRCRECQATLKWFELVPLCSFLVLRGKCRSCGVGISLQYPLVEIAGGLIALTPNVLWMAALYILLFITLVDFRLRIIPDGANIALGALGVIGAFTAKKSALGYLAIWLDAPTEPWSGALLGGLIGMAIFGVILIYTSGRGMGLGDAKLAIALGILFGYPDILLVFMLAFILGAVAGIGYIMIRKATVKDAIPFGPFLAAGSALTLFYGKQILELYLRAFGL